MCAGIPKLTCGGRGADTGVNRWYVCYRMGYNAGMAERGNTTLLFPDLPPSCPGPHTAREARERVGQAIKAYEKRRETRAIEPAGGFAQQLVLSGVDGVISKVSVSRARIKSTSARELGVGELTGALVQDAESAARQEILRVAGIYIHAAIACILVRLSHHQCGVPRLHSYPTFDDKTYNAWNNLRSALERGTPLPSIWSDTGTSFLSNELQAGATNPAIVRLDQEIMQYVNRAIDKFRVLLGPKDHPESQQNIPAALRDRNVKGFYELICPSNGSSPIIVEPSCMITRRSGKESVRVVVKPDALRMGPNDTFIFSIKTGRELSATSPEERGAYALIAASMPTWMKEKYNGHPILPPIGQDENYFNRFFQTGLSTAQTCLAAKGSRPIWFVEIYLSMLNDQPARYSVERLNRLHTLAAAKQIEAYRSGERRPQPHVRSERARRPSIR